MGETGRGAAQYQVGDVVRLKSGGPPMTVTLVGRLRAGLLICEWVSMDGMHHMHEFPLEAVVLVSRGGDGGIDVSTVDDGGLTLLQEPQAEPPQ